MAGVGDMIQRELETFNVIAQATNLFSSLFFKYVVQETYPMSFVSSPLSAALVLVMVGYGACEGTESEFKRVLCLPTLDDLVCAGFHRLIGILTHIIESDIYLENKVFINNEYIVSPTYIQLMETYFNSSTHLINFCASGATNDEIHEYVETKKMCYTENISSTDEAAQEMSMVVVNTIRFSAEWQDKFEIQFTSFDKFYVHRYTVVNAIFMTRRGNYKNAWIPQLNAKFIEIPFKGGDLSMILIVPMQIGGLGKLLTNLQTTSWTTFLEPVRNSTVALYLPRIKLTNKIRLDTVLKKMGMVDAFQASADFSGVLSAPLRISKVEQKMSIDVNENGAETSIDTSKPEESVRNERHRYTDRVPEFRVDRPSYYAICHNYGHVIILSGVITDPRFFYSNSHQTVMQGASAMAEHLSTRTIGNVKRKGR